MATPNESFNLKQVIDACAEHAWKTREAELKRRGIENEAQLRKEIERTISNSKTRACHSHYEQKPDDKPPQQVFRREIYDLRPYNEAHPKYGITVILNPTPDPATGKPHGGTCHIRDRDQFERLRRQERDVVGAMPEIVVGGRVALLEKDKHQQVVEFKPTRPPSFDPKYSREQISPPYQPDTLKPSEPKQPEKLQFKRDAPREQEKGPTQEKPKAPEQEKLVFNRDTGRDHGRDR